MDVRLRYQDIPTLATFTAGTDPEREDAIRVIAFFAGQSMPVRQVEADYSHHATFARIFYPEGTDPRDLIRTILDAQFCQDGPIWAGVMDTVTLALCALESIAA